jgi:hypothetical protein
MRISLYFVPFSRKREKVPDKADEGVVVSQRSLLSQKQPHLNPGARLRQWSLARAGEGVL